MLSMMQKYVLSKRAKKDLANIWRYTVETWSRVQADKYVGGLLSMFPKIADAPEKYGQSYDHVRPGYRKSQYGKHLIFYITQYDGTVLISRILHEKMDYDRHL